MTCQAGRIQSNGSHEAVTQLALAIGDAGKVVVVSERDQVDLLLAIIFDAEDANRVSNLVSFLQHIRFNVGMIQNTRDLLRALPAFYRIKQGKYDIARLEQDIVTWPPIASQIEELRREAAAKAPSPKKV